MSYYTPPADLLPHDAVKVKWSGRMLWGVFSVKVQIEGVTIETSVADTYGAMAALDDMDRGLRALNDAPMPKKRIWVNLYDDGDSFAHRTPGDACASAVSSCRRIAVPFVEET